MSRSGLFLSALLISAGACTGGTDTGNPLTDLEISNCKQLGAEDAPGHRDALTAAGPRYTGLRCFAARRDGDTLELEAHNFSGGCGVEFDANARVRDRALEVVLTNPSCAVAGCGGCLYDATFTVELVGSDNETIPLIDEPCEAEPENLGAWRVPEPGESSVRCTRFANASLSPPKDGTCGSENMPCRRADGVHCKPAPGETVTECEEGLTCTDVGEYDPRCLKQCESKDDCAVSEAMRCEDGVCVL